MEYMNELEQADPTKFQQIMTMLEAEAKDKAEEEGIDMDAIQSAYEQRVSQQVNPLPTGVTLPGDGTLELSKDGNGVRQKDGGVDIVPTPGFVLKTSIMTSSSFNLSANRTKKVFINVCSHDMIDVPAEKMKLNEDGKEVCGMNVPISVGPMRSCADKKGDAAIAVDCVVNPKVLQDVKSDETGSNRDFICQLMIEYVQSKYNSIGKLDQKYKLPKMKYHAYTNSETGEIITGNHEKASVAQQRVRQRKAPSIQEIESGNNISPVEKSISNEMKTNVKAKQEEPFNLEVSLYSILDDGRHVPLDDLFEELKQSIPSIEEADQHVYQLKYPFLCDTPEVKGKPVTHVQVSTRLKDEWCNNVPLVSMSAWCCFIRVDRYCESKTILPFCVDPQSARCQYDRGNATLTVRVNIAASRMNDKPDIGTRAWTLAKGLKGQQLERSFQKKSITDHQNSSHHAENEVSSSKTRPAWSIEDVVLPEDRFHANDALSQCVLEQQRKERQQRIENSSKSRSNDDDIEYIDAGDFKPGGKYYEAPKESLQERNVLSVSSIRDSIGLNIESELCFELI